MAINKLIQNDNEVAWSEDINDAQDLIARDIDRYLEGSYTYNTESTTGSSIPIPKCIIGGFDIAFTLSNTLTVTIGKGMALVDRVETDTWTTNPDGTTHHLHGQLKHNSVQTAYNPTAAFFNIGPNASGTNDRIDVIGVTFKKSSINETRPQQVTIDNRRVITQVSLPKHVEYVVDSFSVWPGTPDVALSARMIDLDFDLTWLPLFAIRVPKSTSGWTVTPEYFDLRLFYQPKSAAGTLTGPVQPVQASTMGVLEDGLYNEWLYIYKNSIADNGFLFPIKGSSKNSDTEVATAYFPISVNNAHYTTLMAAGDARSINKFYYLYSFRPSARTGYMSILMTSIPPNAGFFTSTNQACNPSTGLIPPAPFPYVFIKNTVYYLASTKLYTNDADLVPRTPTEYQFRPFKKTGNYVMLPMYRKNIAADTYEGPGFEGNEIVSLSTTSPTSYHLVGALSAAYNGSTQGIIEVVPPHATGIKVELLITTAGSGIVKIAAEVGETDFATVGHAFEVSYGAHVTGGGTDRCSIDIPFYTRTGSLPQEPKFWLVTNAGSSVLMNVWVFVTGYYE